MVGTNTAAAASGAYANAGTRASQLTIATAASST